MTFMPGAQHSPSSSGSSGFMSRVTGHSKVRQRQKYDKSTKKETSSLEDQCTAILDNLNIELNNREQVTFETLLQAVEREENSIENDLVRLDTSCRVAQQNVDDLAKKFSQVDMVSRYGPATAVELSQQRV